MLKYTFKEVKKSRDSDLQKGNVVENIKKISKSGTFLQKRIANKISYLGETFQI